VLSFAHAGPGNYQTVGYAGMAATLRQVAGAALAQAGLAIEQVAAAGLGISGYDWPSQREQMIGSIREAGIAAPVEIVNDAVLGLLAGAEQGWGLALVAGTGSNCRGRDRAGREGRVSGEGVRFGEYGGASELVFLALQAVSRAWSRRGASTRLSDAFVAAAGARDLDDLVEGLALGRYHISADAAPLVFQAAGAGDAVAQAVIEQAARELAGLAIGVTRQLGLERETFEVVLVGGLYAGGALLTGPLREAIRAVAPGARLTRLATPPVVGAVLLAMQHDGALRNGATIGGLPRAELLAKLARGAALLQPAPTPPPGCRAA
jgi:N-acetylglucosamine kinase-like BadF-type ATPase